MTKECKRYGCDINGSMGAKTSMLLSFDSLRSKFARSLVETRQDPMRLVYPKTVANASACVLG
jgi:hypothetical protein